RIEGLPADFHQRAAVETASFLDALGIEEAILWGHSDGAVIAVLMGLTAPSRFSGLILEAFHYMCAKTGSRDFFQTMVSAPENFGERVYKTLESEYGDRYWRNILEYGGRAWLRIIEGGKEKDLYGGRLSKLSVPALFIHGSRD